MFYQLKLHVRILKNNNLIRYNIYYQISHLLKHLVIHNFSKEFSYDLALYFICYVTTLGSFLIDK